MNQRDITAYRLTSQYIDTPSTNISAAEVVQYMGAMQAQDYHGTLWAIGLRTGLVQSDVIAAIKNREIARTWPQRGTLHFVPSKDALWMVNLSADRLLRAAVSRQAQLGLDMAVLSSATMVLTLSLRGGNVLSRLRIMDILQDNGINTENGRGYHILWYLAQKGTIISGPMDGKQQTFALLDEWVTDSHILSREKSLQQLTKRYFISHGPATLQDFMWWSGLKAIDAKIGLKANITQLECHTIDGKDYWSKSKPDNQDSDDNDTAFLLPGFDEYMLGYKDRSAALDPAHASKIVPGNNGMFLPTIIINGKVVGTWKRHIKKSGVVVTLSPFEKMTNNDIKSLDIPLKRYERFIELPVDLHWS
ncbi:MAG: winged helix DNA-binding domain-containing protein [Candidatus Saccharimonadales bacterium]